MLRRLLPAGAGLHDILPLFAYGEQALPGRRSDGLVELGEEVAVPVEGHVDRPVRHPGLDGLWVGALGDGQGDAGVPEVMKSTRHAGSVEPLREVVLPEA